MPILLLQYASLYIEIKAHNFGHSDHHTCKGQRHTFIVVGMDSIRLIATKLATMRSRCSDLIDLGKKAGLKTQQKFHYRFKYNIDCPPDNLADYHKEFLIILSAIPRHDDIVTVQWETGESPSTSSECEINKAGISSPISQLLELLARGAQLFNAGNDLLRRRAFDAALFRYRTALATVEAATDSYSWGEHHSGLLPSKLQGRIQVNMVFCCAEQAGATNMIIPETNRFYLARIQH
ncbi:hypothetical protein TWF481_002926 [Arthrobotrys musiformis]|uniref:Uncharacterized protein n=1 Tax=Arthrobotrys musiformis TaxID=47236 RepID=A0AAV9VTM3_9PEZI